MMFQSRAFVSTNILCCCDQYTQTIKRFCTLKSDKFGVQNSVLVHISLKILFLWLQRPTPYIPRTSQHFLELGRIWKRLETHRWTDGGYYLKDARCHEHQCIKSSGTGCKDCVALEYRDTDGDCAECNPGYYSVLDFQSGVAKSV